MNKSFNNENNKKRNAKTQISLVSVYILKLKIVWWNRRNNIFTFLAV